MARTMTVTLDGEVHTLGEVETRGAMHVVALTSEGRNFYLANRPDTQLVELRGEELHVRASFIRNCAEWNLAGDRPARVTADEKRAELHDEKRRKAAADEKAARDAQAENDANDTSDPYDRLTKVELQTACEHAGLSKSGSKADMVERLRAQDDPETAVE